MEKKIESIFLFYNSLVDLLYNILTGSPVNKEEIYCSLFGVIVLDLIINKEDMVKNKEGIVYESLMSDNQLEDILKYINIENIDKNNNGASIYATIRNKLAHGDYFIQGNDLIFNTNGKQCKILLNDFISYYMDLTKSLKCRFKDNKFVKNQIVDKSLGKFDKLLKSREDILDYLKYLTYKEFIFRKQDNSELSSEEKTIFVQSIFNLYNRNNIKDEKKSDYIIKQFFNNKGYQVDIKNKKIKKLYGEKLNEIEKIINRNNNNYDNNVKYINHILYETAEDIYRLIENDYEHYSIKYGLENLMVMLDTMLKNNIYDFDKFVENRNNIDSFYLLGLPMHEIVISIILTLIYFSYCYPLEKIYKNDKVFTTDLINDFDFTKLNLDEIKPDINKLYDLGVKNVLDEEKIKLNSYKKKYLELNNSLEEKLNQRKNLIEKYNKSNELKLKEIIDRLTKDIISIYNNFEYYLHIFYNQENKVKELEERLKNTDINYYNYTVINGIRNAISHGNISLKNIATKDLKDVEIEFIDIYENDIKFKLKIKLDNLFSLIEIENINSTNKYLKNKLLKTK